MGWLTSRKEILKIGSSVDCSEIPDLIVKWCETNGLEKPRKGIYPNNIEQPKE
jgi:hypothetical protein